ncbi:MULTISPECIES: monovalent cation:proton antiporter-2 (CPA2) family protein [Alteromonadaceae]|uniref:monovalent cation:proton antiporter-2 (CPA2) family protein n=1 Tax=Alteromonadaceae TaxID=72275 RepID=UPI001C09B9F9|nr:MULTISPECIES: monovalent cation:proton antiporter-2 (CPA2) family protein [Aliiglaciecola]MBU2879620.1 monovalent cation:proton antiporter-2 (CPA2) family protein [Aliiglaciecola lipolytica]MDO6710100.1 monovalent cation:proton antiporter-2 (CPA2) family protein [Aliiglaciecola sp. 2_MG-2023]MDO6751248.1 monovalent cation:proton antiporter-2 (CPA2) family protein [Aliiglaciecola sp. 1_MG-2023]
MSLLGSTMIFLAAAVVAVPIFKRLKLGAILGYLVAGMVIGPSIMDWVSKPETILHFAELGVVFLLFIIGLELEPKKLLKMRDQIVFTGGGQLFLSASFIAISVKYIVGTDWTAAIVIGLAVALSSTAFAIQLMENQNILKTPPGQKGFSILLMQDLAVIPILLLVQSLSTVPDVDSPAWWVSICAIVAVLIIGKFLINPFLRLISHWGNAEIMTSAALLIVIATALGMQEAGLSMGMGAFVAGMLLANSSFKHQLEAEIEPFKGLLLGLFFIAIGMNLDLDLFFDNPLVIIAAALTLIAIKTAIIFSILKFSKQSTTDSMRIALMLSQGGEFAFVVMGEASLANLIAPTLASQVTLVVGVSMALTSPLVILHSIWFNSRNCPAVYDSQTDTDEPRVIIAGFGRFGQVTGRILAANKIPFTALDKDAEHIAFVKKFGNKVFYGDATRLDLLKISGIEQASILLIAIDNEVDTFKIVALVSEQFPHVKMVVRARNRNAVMRLSKVENLHFVRELFWSGLRAAEKVLEDFGFDKKQAAHMCDIFEKHDEKILKEVIDADSDLDELIQLSKKGRADLETLFANDIKQIGGN